jgi:hypothetical protein
MYNSPASDIDAVDSPEEAHTTFRAASHGTQYNHLRLLSLEIIAVMGISYCSDSIPKGVLT